MKKRFIDLICKLISVKGIVWIAATVLFVLGLLTWYAWLIVSFAFIGIRYLEKLIPNGIQPPSQVGFQDKDAR